MAVAGLHRRSPAAANTADRTARTRDPRRRQDNGRPGGRAYRRRTRQSHEDRRHRRVPRRAGRRLHHPVGAARSAVAEPHRRHRLRRKTISPPAHRRINRTGRTGGRLDRGTHRVGRAESVPDRAGSTAAHPGCGGRAVARVRTPGGRALDGVRRPGHGPGAVPPDRAGRELAGSSDRDLPTPKRDRGGGRQGRRVPRRGRAGHGAAGPQACAPRRPRRDRRPARHRVPPRRPARLRR